MAGHAHYREAHPLVFVITHWINLICMIMLAFSGFYIHYPFFGGFMGVARGMHFVAMYVIIINLTFRIIAAFMVKTATDLGSRQVDTDIKNWLPQEKNKHQFFETIKYYLFLRKEAVISAKYGSLQKIAYLATIPLTYLMAYTGFAIYGPTMNWGLFSGGVEMVGGPMSMRIIHYFMMWVFIVFTMIHAYLANIYNFKPSKIIFAWKESE
ncbi:MAG: cytochrome b/b6 domain-containing protein [Coriobacteriia bacterium]|nr:cytochrome b/b6 domain-containing protein [Actinomycetota bacterium]MDZ4167930.1 cytochrome b/b6 domain-containing protein [Coriobacteriia bacterium]